MLYFFVSLSFTGQMLGGSNEPDLPVYNLGYTGAFPNQNVSALFDNITESMGHRICSNPMGLACSAPI